VSFRFPVGITFAGEYFYRFARYSKFALHYLSCQQDFNGQSNHKNDPDELLSAANIWGDSAYTITFYSGLVNL